MTPTTKIVNVQLENDHDVVKKISIKDSENENSLHEIFQQVMKDERQSPLSLKNFQGYLEQTFRIENFNFLVAAMAFKAKYLQALSSSSLSSANTSEEMNQEASIIVQKFVKIGALEEINIGADMRERIESDVKSLKVSPNIFDAAEREIRQILKNGPFTEFYEKMTSENLSKNEANFRLRQSMLSLVCFLIQISITIALEFYGINPNHYYRFLTFLPAIVGIGFYIQYRERLCPYCRYLGVSTALTEMSLVDALKHGTIVEVKDALVRRSLDLKLFWIYVRAATYSCFVMALVFAIPPYSNL